MKLPSLNCFRRARDPYTEPLEPVPHLDVAAFQAANRPRPIQGPTFPPPPDRTPFAIELPENSRDYYIADARTPHVPSVLPATYLQLTARPERHLLSQRQAPPVRDPYYSAAAHRSSAPAFQTISGSRPTQTPYIPAPTPGAYNTLRNPAAASVHSHSVTELTPPSAPYAAPATPRAYNALNYPGAGPGTQSITGMTSSTVVHPRPMHVEQSIRRYRQPPPSRNTDTADPGPAYPDGILRSVQDRQPTPFPDNRDVSRSSTSSSDGWGEPLNNWGEPVNN